MQERVKVDQDPSLIDLYANDDYPQHFLKQILTEVQCIALVGASPRSDRDSYQCMRVLLKRGYEVIPVNPRAAGELILGKYCYPSLAAIDQTVDMVDIFRTSDAAFGVTQEAIIIGARVVWMQLDVINRTAADLAESAGLKVVMNRCPKLELQKLYCADLRR
ncbi:MAG: CoA-binding protein [Cellvibrionales bacterium]|nr:CoA-binding protein [Porticoccaceae bacterium]|tara:strand:+ start:5033 stop:5518 length:486 start_codon:yes stop_codon:yes gene_type:complete